MGLFFLVVVSGCSGEPRKVTLTSSDAEVVIRRKPFSISVRDRDGAVVLESYRGQAGSAYGAISATVDDPRLFEQILPGWDGYEANEAPWTHAAKGTFVKTKKRSAELELKGDDGGTFTVKVSLDGARVRIMVTGEDNHRELNKVALAFLLPPDEHFFGLGEKVASLDHRGLSLYSWAEEGGTGGGENTSTGPQNPYPNGPSMTYFPVPFFLSTAGFGMHIDTTYRSEVHFGSEQPDAWRLAVNAAATDLTVYVHNNPLDTLRDYTADTGRPPVPAPWVFGPRRRSSKSHTVDGVPEYIALRERGVPTTGIDDSTHFLPARSELGREDDLAAWTDEAHRWGYKVMAYYNPYVSESKESAAADYAYGEEHELFVKDPRGNPSVTWFSSGSIQNLSAIDLTNPEGVAWFKDLMRRAIALGYDGWMHDFGEYTKRDDVFFNGKRGDEMHNLYPVLSATAAYELWEEERPDDYLFFVRSGYTGTQAVVPAVWCGDPEATFDETQGMPAMLRGGLNLAMSAVPYWGSDISGYKCLTDFPRDKEVYLRWAEMGAVSPIMMEQNACVKLLGGQDTKWTLWSDEETVEVYGAMSRLHTRLQPYFLVLAALAHRTGQPLMMHPFLLFPDHEGAWAVEDSFYLGPSLYASPVVRRGVTTKQTWLPPGRYVDLDDHRVYEGPGEVGIPAPLDKLPLLLTSGHLVPMLDPSIETLGEAINPDVVTPETVKDRLDVVVALGEGEAAQMTLADGTSLRASRTGSGGSAALTEVAEMALEDCASCWYANEAGDVARLRVNTSLGTASTLEIDDVILEVADSPIARRIRWDISRL